MKNVLVTNIFRKIPDISLSLILSITTEERCERYIILQQVKTKKGLDQITKPISFIIENYKNFPLVPN